MMIFGGVLAGGSGTRMETAVVPKQFIRVCGIPVFIRTLRTFLSVDGIEKVIVSTNTEWTDEYLKLLDEFCIDRTRVVLTQGGNSRFASLVNIVKTAQQIADEKESIIVTHDCARLFVSKKIIQENIAATTVYDMVTTSIPVIDTILYSDDGKYSSGVPDRSKLWSDQGPQTFSVNKFLEYLSMVPEEELEQYIEAGKLFLNHDSKIGIVQGSRFNFKITNDLDLQYAEFLIKKDLIK